MHNLTLGSLFDGSGGFPLGGMLNEISPIWASEIEPFPIRVTTKNIPQMKHLGDISTIDGAKIEPVDIITFGSPCTNLSIAGKREGLEGKQSSLFYQAIRIIKEMRNSTNGKYPRYIVWENVMGAFSSNHGEDFRTVLESIAQIKDETVLIPQCEKWTKAGGIMGDDYSISYRTFDAQFFGVPQRRKRIYLVADFNGKSSDKILFNTKSVPRDFTQSVCSWQKTAKNTRSCTSKTSNDVVFENHGQDIRYKQLEDVAPTVSANYGLGGNNQPFVVSAYDVRQTSEGTKNSRNNIYETDISRTIDTSGNLPWSNQGGVAVIQGSMIGRNDENGPQGSGVNEDVSFTLNATDKHAVVYALDRESFNSGQGFARSVGVSENGINSTLNAQGPSAVGVPTFTMTTGSFMQVNEEKSPTLASRDYKDPPLVNVKSSYGFYPQMKAECMTLLQEKSNCLINGTNPGFQNGVLEQDYIIRRLTPTECARLQGFPDFWCSDLSIENPTDEDIAFWRDVFETHRKVMGKSSKPKSDKQIIKWLKAPHSDSAEYKMWGNGVALPCVYFVLHGIVMFNNES